jgi:hypothetical protein
VRSGIQPAHLASLAVLEVLVAGCDELPQRLHPDPAGSWIRVRQLATEANGFSFSEEGL